MDVFTVLILRFFNSVRLRILFTFFFILLPVLDGMLYNVTMVFLFIFQITAGARCIFVLRNFEGHWQWRG